MAGAHDPGLGRGLVAVVQSQIPFRVRAVAAALIDRSQSNVLILQRDKPSSRGLWSLPMGEIEADEDPAKAVRREIGEELRVSGGALYSAGCCDIYYSHKAGAVHVTPIFVLLFDRAPEIALNAEHSDFAWTNVADAVLRLAYPGQRQALAEIERDFIVREPPAFRFIGQ